MLFVYLVARLLCQKSQGPVRYLGHCLPISLASHTPVDMWGSVSKETRGGFCQRTFHLIPNFFNDLSS